MNHTPGPWRVDDVNFNHEDSSAWASIRSADWIIAEIFDDYGRPGEARANARLIAAAPELLEAAIIARRVLLQSTVSDYELDRARDALALTIAKAAGVEGQTSVGERDAYD